MDTSRLAHIDSVVGAGKAVIAGDDRSIVAVVRAAIEADTSVSFYLTRKQADAVKEWYWTPEWTEASGIQPISGEEAERIRSELGIDNLTNFRFSPILCECGHTYGAFDFLEQGVREHGLEAVKAVFSLKNSTFLQVNPPFIPVCPASKHELRSERMAGGGITYEGDDYGGCSCCATARSRANSANSG